jgi:transaldolase/glucose-6-phosphate isomerase
MEEKMSKFDALASLGEYQAVVDAALAEMAESRVVARIWAHDYTVWKPALSPVEGPEPKEITNRLGWLHIAEAMQVQLPRLDDLVASVQAEGYTDVLLLGMGGSSLAPQVFSRVFVGRVANPPNSLRLAVLDSTDPGAVLAQAERLDPARTLFLVATKSGGTVETLSFFKFFYNWTADALGAGRAGRHFVAITDAGSKLDQLAQTFHFRATFLNDPNIGGRYSALSFFGLVPAALVGVNLSRLLERARDMAAACGPDVAAGDNPGVWLGAILGELAKAGRDREASRGTRDKVTFVTAPELANFGDWLEQLIAESTGKEGVGILPVVGEPLGPPEVYGDDRLFVVLEIGDERLEVGPDTHPLIRLPLRDVYDLGAQMFLWEFATGVAGSRLGINPFNQPSVEAAKVLARQAVAVYGETGKLPDDEPAPLDAQVLNDFLGQAKPGDYVALQAFVQPTTETSAALQTLRLRLRDRLKLATTVGYGPRFLHSTGQLHKGDRGNGLFLQFTSDPLQDAPIPDEAGKPESSMTFGVLKMAQALGDKGALEAAGRRVIRFHLGTDVVGNLTLLTEASA